MNNQKNGGVRVRFAPSPTGHLHIGGLRTALFNWLFARHAGGTYLMRVEDTDITRSTHDYLQSQLTSLKWAGLISDEPIVYQASRKEEHLKVAHDLIKQKKAYPCFCPARDADEVIQNLEQGIGQKYNGTCRDKVFTDSDLSKPHAIRYKHDAHGPDIEFQDSIRGSIRVKADQLDDFVIMRRDGFPTYNFCVVIDDIFMKITHIIRGEDHISNTPKQVVLYQALNAVLPAFAHLPLILGKSGQKLSKRDAAVSVEEYRAQGFLASALMNYLVRLGWSHGDQEIFSLEELISFFSLDSVGKKGAIFDPEKLTWLNGVYLRKCSASELLAAFDALDPALRKKLGELWTEEKLVILLDLYKQRATNLNSLYQDIASFATDQAKFDLELIANWRTEKTKELLVEFLQSTEQVGYTHDELLKQAQMVCKNFGLKLVTLAQPLRLALTGTIQSPGVFELLEIVGHDHAQKRIKSLIEQL